MGISSASTITTIPRCYNTDGSAVTVAANTVITTPWYPEGVPLPNPQQGAADWAKNLAQNVSPTQQPGVL